MHAVTHAQHGKALAAAGEDGRGTICRPRRERRRSVPPTSRLVSTTAVSGLSQLSAGGGVGGEGLHRLQAPNSNNSGGRQVRRDMGGV